MDDWSWFRELFGKPATSTEQLVIAWAVILLAAAAGIVNLGMGLMADPAQGPQVVQQRWLGVGLLVFALAAWFVHRSLEWWLDR